MLDTSRIAIVRCCQTNKQHKTKLLNLLREDGQHLAMDYLKKGRSLMLQYKGKEYPVQFLQFQDEVEKESSEQPKNTKKRGRRKLEDEVEGVPHALREHEKVVNILDQAQKKQKQEITPKVTSPESSTHSEKSLLKHLISKVDKMEKTMSELVGLMKSRPQYVDSTVDNKPESSDEVINGRNVMRLPARDAYAFALLLLDALFTKKELSKSLFFKSDKSSKPGLDEDKIKLLLTLLERRFKTDWNMKTLVSKANQKCSNSKPDCD